MPQPVTGLAVVDVGADVKAVRAQANKTGRHILGNFLELLQSKLGECAAVKQGVSCMGVEEACVHFFSIGGLDPRQGGGSTIGLGSGGKVYGSFAIEDEVFVAVFCD